MHRITLKTLDHVTPGVATGTDNLRDALDHVPGTVLRGALAARWIAEHGPPTGASAGRREEFVTLFERDLRFGPLLPQGSSVEPLGQRACKYQPAPECVRAAHEADATVAQACPTCYGPMESGKGRVLPAVTLVERTRVQLEHGRAADGALYSTRAYPPGTVFVGAIAGEHPWLHRLPETVWVGGRRSVGGRCRLRAEPVDGPRPAARALATQVLVRLRSPGVFVDAATRPTQRFPLEEIEAIVGRAPLEAGRWTRPVRVNGWHAASGLPKPTEIAVAAGSEALLTFGEALGADALARLAARGLGLRTVEGFGWIDVNPVAAPIAASETGAEAAGEDESALDAHRALVPDDLVPWLRGRLKEVIERREGGETADEAARVVLDRPQVRRRPPTERAALEALLRKELHELDDLALLIELEDDRP